MYTTSSNIRDVFIIPALCIYVSRMILSTKPDLSSNSINQLIFVMHPMLPIW